MPAMGCHTFAIPSPLMSAEGLGPCLAPTCPLEEYFLVEWPILPHMPRDSGSQKLELRAAASSTARQQETTENWGKERMAQNLQITVSWVNTAHAVGRTV